MYSHIKILEARWNGAHEKIVLSQLQTQVEENGILEEFQYAYGKYHSSETALLDVTSALLDHADEG